MHYNLTKEIINLSVSQFWDTAKDEWNFEYAYQSEESQTCLCGHYPIRNICVIKNQENDNKTEVGNCCVNKFLGIDSGNKIFDSIKRLKDDISRTMSAEVLEYMNNKKVITKYEYDFYTDTLRKRKLTEKQLIVREKINQKFLDFTSYEVNSILSKIGKILKWATSHKEFDSNYVESLKTSSSRNRKLTEKQSQALDNIIKKWKIN
jgi:hypothetical protein